MHGRKGSVRDVRPMRGKRKKIGAMSLRNHIRRLQRVASAFAVADSSPTLPSGPVILFSCHDADRSMRGNDGRFSPLLEGIRKITEELGYSGINLTHPFALFAGSQIKDGSITINYRALRSRSLPLLRRILRVGSPVNPIERETALYRSLLDRLGPRAIISIQPPYGLCRAARQMGILVVEAMHGTNYHLEDKVFRSHWAQPDELLPNVLLSFDDVSHKTMLAWTGGRDISAVQGGDPWLHHLRCEAAADPGRSSGKDMPEGRRNQVLVTLQWGYDGEREALGSIVPNGVLHPALEAAIARSVGQYRFLIRMHPIQLNKTGYRHHRRYIRSLAARYPNVEWEQASARPLPLLLDEVFAHITMSSSAVGEAATAGVPSLMLCPTLHPGGANHGMFADLAAAGHVTFGKLDENAILEWLESKAASLPSPPPYEVEKRHGAELALYRGLMERAERLRSGGRQERERKSLS